jgi:uncharacterized protein involved in response to NO
LFTRNALTDDSIRPLPAINTAAVIGALTVAAAEVVAPNGYPMAVVAGAAGVLVLARSVFWGFPNVLGRPILWILHVGHAWIWIGLFLKAAAAANRGVPASVATHALTAGAIGSLTLGMMSRVTLGHTGRPLQVSSMMVVAFVAITVSASLRVLGPLIRADLTRDLIVASAGFWGLAFALYVVVNARYLVTSRPDGKQG